MRTIHVSASVRGLLRRSNRELNGIVQDDTGRTLTGKEARELLLDELQQGNLFLKCGPCDNFSPAEGCLGHEQPETDEPPAGREVVDGAQ
jgi:hypothetical protein